MEEFSIGYNELMNFPFERYLEHAKIINLQAKEEKKEAEKERERANSKV